MGGGPGIKATDTPRQGDGLSLPMEQAVALGEHRGEAGTAMVLGAGRDCPLLYALNGPAQGRSPQSRQSLVEGAGGLLGGGGNTRLEQYISGIHLRPSG